MLQLAEPFLDPGSRTWWVSLVVAALVAVAIGVARGGSLRTLIGDEWSRLRHPSSRLDIQLLLGRQLLALVGALPGLAGGFWLATHLVRQLDALLGVPDVPAVPPVLLTVLYSATLFVTWDLSRYVLHRLLHEVPLLWELHQVHHSAAVLTPLTFHRLHPLESVLYQLRGVVVTGLVAGGFFWLFRGAAVDWTLLGVHGVGLLCNVATGNLRHSHHWLPFPPAVEVWLLSPAQHQIHHALDPRLHGANYGTWLAVWDRLGGTLRVADMARPTAFGLPEGERNHRDDLLSAWLGPLAATARRLRPGAVLLLLGLARPATAQDPDPSGEADDEAVMELIVVSRDGVPRVAGSAHVLDEEDLERFEYDDIQKILATVPGVYPRNEDGFGLRPNIGIRGANADRSKKVTLLEDGVLLAPAPYAAPAAYYFPMSARMVGVEVFKGPAATQHGPHTVGGAVNLITRPVPDAPAASFDQAAGSYGTLKTHLWTGTGNERRGVLVEGVHLTSGGFKELDTGGPTGFRRAELMVKGRTELDGRRQHAVELKLGYSNERSFETYLGLERSDFRRNPYRRYAATSEDLMGWHRTQAELAWQARLGPRVRVRTVAYHHYLTRAWTKFNRFASGVDLATLLREGAGAGQGELALEVLRGRADSQPDDPILVGTNDRRFHAWGVQSRLRWDVEGEAVSSRFEAGLRFHGDDVARLHTEDPFDMIDGTLQRAAGPILTNLDATDTARALAAHVHEDLEVGVLHLLPGGRLEVIHTRHEARSDEPLEVVATRAIALPGMAVLVEVTPTVDLFAGIHEGFSPIAPVNADTSPPERAWNSEAGVRVAGRELTLEAVGFRSDYANLTADCGVKDACAQQDLGTQFDFGRVQVYGVESVVGVAPRLPARLTLPVEASYTLTESRFLDASDVPLAQYGQVSPGDDLPYVPLHQGSLTVTLSHPRFRLSGLVSGRSGMHHTASDGPREDIGGLVLVDLAADAVLTDQLELYATLTNTAGVSPVTSWLPIGARPPAPRTLMAGVKGRFGKARR